MKLPASVRSAFLLLIGLAIGGVGMSLFKDSLTGPEDSPEHRIATLERDLKRAHNEIAAIADTDSQGRRKSVHTTSDSLRDIRDRLQSGKPVTPDDIFRLSQPFMRDLAPVVERMRVHEQKSMVDRMSGELARTYQLDARQQTALRHWFDARTEQNARDWTDLVTSEKTQLKDLMKAARYVRSDDGLDEFMPNILSGKQLDDFRSQRMTERVERVQQHADAMTERLHSIVPLDEVQRDQIFGIMARSSSDFDPSMQLEGGAGEIPNTPAPTNREEAILALLRPDQQELYREEIRSRRDREQKDLAAIGLTLPEDWNPFEFEDF